MRFSKEACACLVFCFPGFLGRLWSGCVIVGMIYASIHRVVWAFIFCFFYVFVCEPWLAAVYVVCGGTPLSTLLSSRLHWTLASSKFRSFFTHGNHRGSLCGIEVLVEQEERTTRLVRNRSRDLEPCLVRKGFCTTNLCGVGLYFHQLRRYHLPLLFFRRDACFPPGS